MQNGSVSFKVLLTDNEKRYSFVNGKLTVTLKIGSGRPIQYGLTGTLALVAWSTEIFLVKCFRQIEGILLH